MIKMIPSGLKIDEAREEEKSLEYRARRPNFTRVLEILQYTFDLEVALCQIILMCFHVRELCLECTILLSKYFPTVQKKAEKYLLPDGQFPISLFQLLLTFKQIHQQQQLIQQKSSWSQTQSGHRHQESDS